jgi:tol-pal system protein YbgF
MALRTGAACAQSEPRLSLADRVAALEARVQQNQSAQSVEQTNRIAQLDADVKALRALVEQMQNDQQQAHDRDKAQYSDIDSRLSKLEGAATAPPPVASARPSATHVAAPPPAQAPPPPPAASGSGAVAAPSPVNEQAAYDAALAAVRADQYADSAQRFNAFVQQFPDSALAPNAYYWLGESYYVTQNYQLALDAFKNVVTRFPDSPKTPGALLKLGYSQDGLKQRDAAQATLREVIQKYPNSDEAGQAESRLRAMSMDAGG